MLPRNKSTLDRMRRQLATYRRVLPSLELKRRQLSSEIAAARAQLAALEGAQQGDIAVAGARLPMAANEQMALTGLVSVKAVRLSEEHRLGIALPRLDRVEWEVLPYSRLAKPHWVDPLVAEVRRVGERRLQAQVLRERVVRLVAGLTRTIQRINLFEKSLVPRTEQEIRRIRVALGDLERDAIVRAKIAKARQATTRAGGRQGRASSYVPVQSAGTA